MTKVKESFGGARKLQGRSSGEHGTDFTKLSDFSRGFALRSRMTERAGGGGGRRADSLAPPSLSLSLKEKRNLQIRIRRDIEIESLVFEKNRKGKEKKSETRITDGK